MGGRLVLREMFLQEIPDEYKMISSLFIILVKLGQFAKKGACKVIEQNSKMNLNSVVLFSSIFLLF